MRTSKATLFLLIIFLMHSGLCTAQNTYYVSSDGSNANPGTESLPWETIQYGVENISGGDTLIIKEGLYEQTGGVLINNNLTPNISGSESDLTVIRAEGKVVIESGDSNVSPIIIEGSLDIPVQYLKIENFHLFNYTYGIHMEYVDNCSIKKNFSTIKLLNCNNNIITENKYFRQRLDKGIHLSDSDNNTIINNIFYDNWLGHVKGGSSIGAYPNVFLIENSSNTLITENYVAYNISIRDTISSSEYYYRHGNAAKITANSTNTLIHNNYFANNIILIENSSTNCISNNIFTNKHNSSFLNQSYYYRDRGYGDQFKSSCIYVTAPQDGLRIENNVFSFALKDREIVKFVDQPLSNVTINNNVFSYNSRSSNINQVLFFENTPEDFTNLTVYNNAYNNKIISLTNIDYENEGNIQVENPFFRDESMKNFQLLSNSPCKNSGKDGIDMGIYGGEYAFDDTDNDGMPDYWESTFNLNNVVQDDSEDQDYDGASNFYEYFYKLNPLDNDSDNDLLNDFEMEEYNSSPYIVDTDFDEISDYHEVFVYGTSPVNIDTDTDGISDYDEIYGWTAGETVYTTDPNNPDNDGDGLKDGQEQYYQTNPYDSDTDNDGLTDGQEVYGFYIGYQKFTSNPNLKDTDGDNLDDFNEFTHFTDPQDIMSNAENSPSITITNWEDYGNQKKITGPKPELKGIVSDINSGNSPIHKIEFVNKYSNNPPSDSSYKEALVVSGKNTSYVTFIFEPETTNSAYNLYYRAYDCDGYVTYGYQRIYFFKDSDLDGLLDDFETDHNLNPNSAYTNIYEHSLVEVWEKLEYNDHCFSSNNNTYLVSFSHSEQGLRSTLSYILFSKHGYPLTKEIQIPTELTAHKTCANGSTYLCCWLQEINGQHQFKALVIEESGQHSNPILIADNFILPEYGTWDIISAPWGYCIVYESSNEYDNHGLSVVSLNTQGQILYGPTPLNSIIEDIQQYPDMATDGTDVCIVWEAKEQENDSYNVYARFVSESGVADEPEIILNNTANTWLMLPKIASNGSTFIATWLDNATQLQTGRVIFNKHPINEEIVAPSTATYSNGITSLPDGRYYRTWINLDTSTQPEIWTIFGQYLDNEGIAESLPVSIYEKAYGDIGPCYQITVNNTNDIMHYIRHDIPSDDRMYYFILTDEIVTKTDEFFLNDYYNSLTGWVTSSTDSFGVLWGMYDSPYSPSLWLQILSKQSPDDYDADWLDNNAETDSGSNQYIIDSDNDGFKDYIENLDSDNDELSDADEIFYHTNRYLPDTDNDGWNDIEEISQFHTDPLIPYLQTGLFELPDDTGDPVITEYLFNNNSLVSFSEDFKIRLMDSTGSQQIDPINIDPENEGFDNMYYSRSIASAGNTFLITWQGQFSSEITSPYVYGLIIDNDGSTVYPASLIHQFSSESGYPTFIGSNSEEYIIAWEDNEGIVYGKTINTDGTISDTTIIPSNQIIRINQEYQTTLMIDNYLYLSTQSNKYAINEDYYVKYMVTSGRPCRNGYNGFIADFNDTPLTDEFTIFDLKNYTMMPRGTMLDDMMAFAWQGAFGNEIVFLNHQGERVGEISTLFPKNINENNFASNYYLHSCISADENILIILESQNTHYAAYLVQFDSDFDRDGLSNQMETILGTNMADNDSDQDRIADNTEIEINTDPLNPDTDGDGLSDGKETLIHHTNPCLADTDNDGQSDKFEVMAGSNPNDPNSLFAHSVSQNIEQGVIISWTGIAGNIYEIRVSDSINGSYSHLISIECTEDGTQTITDNGLDKNNNNYSDELDVLPPELVENRFYKIAIIDN